MFKNKKQMNMINSFIPKYRQGIRLYIVYKRSLNLPRASVFIYTVCFFVLFFFSSCLKKEPRSCEDLHNRFFSRIAIEEISQFYGLLLTSRGINEDGSIKLRAIELRSQNEQSIGIPFIENGIKKLTPNTYINIVKFAKHFGQDKNKAIPFVREYCKKMGKAFSNLGVTEINSNLKLGVFVVFTFSDNCALVYKTESSQIYNKKWQFFFQNTTPIRKNWYPLYD